MILDFSCGGGWVLKIILMLTQFSTKLELKLKLSLAKYSFQLNIVDKGWGWGVKHADIIIEHYLVT